MGRTFRITEASTTRRRKKTRTNQSFRMAFLVKYIAFVAAFLSATQLVNSTELKVVHATDVMALKDYADYVEKEDCSPFDPLDTSLIDASALDAASLYQLLVLRHTGALIEVCTPKAGSRYEEDRLFFSTIVALISISGLLAG